MELLALSEREVKVFKTKKPHIVISVYSPDSKPVELPEQKSRLYAMFLCFSDIDEKHAECGRLFTREQAKQILATVRLFKCSGAIDLIVINCEAGICRSAGIAGALDKIINKENFRFFKSHIPNRFVYRTIIEEYYN